MRQQLLIDEKVQGALLKRAGFYSVACALYFIVILIFAECMSRQDISVGEAIFGCFAESIYWLPGLLLMAPMIAYDMLRQTNRFAGPVFRLRREMQRLVANESDRPLNFRDDDYWTEMADEFNQIRSELIELRKAQALSLASKATKESKLFDDAEEQGEEAALFGNLVS
ncbi:hypothetical protein [Rubripirellula obstinata]|uniref:hypothetical protein n=1 Tax=Rubripirellula obstinata TaxID=406547 RepID=UPI00122C96A6|nr:hypothetical protein [Rubripirellula obstinata]